MSSIEEETSSVLSDKQTARELTGKELLLTQKLEESRKNGDQEDLVVEEVKPESPRNTLIGNQSPYLGCILTYLES